MSSLPPIKRISREDLQNAPDWIDRLLYPINLFFDSVYRALSGQLLFVDNIVAQKYSFQLTAGAASTNNTLKFTSTLNKKPEGLILLSAIEKNTNYVPIASSVYIDWYYDGNSIFISSITGLTNTKIYLFNILII